MPSLNPKPKWKYLKKIIPIAAAALALPLVRAHCPLCTVGAGAAAAGAMYLGVSTIVIGLFIGAFAISTGYWISKLIKKQYFPYQNIALILASFLLTIIPIMPLIPGFTPWYISWFGEYGSIFNRTYLLNNFVVGSIIGASIVSLTPSISKKISDYRNTTIAFQGVILTLLSLIITGVIIHLVVS